MDGSSSLANLNKKVVLLVGGVGGAKLAYGLYQILPPENLTIIVNTGDDFWHYGLRICPDLDTVMYTLAGEVNKENGWGLANETYNALAFMEKYGDTPWFRLGDKDFATHIRRTQLWYEGESLTEITRKLIISLGIQCTILPMADSPVATMVGTLEQGELPFQQYFVKHRWQPTVEALRLEGIEQATVSEPVKQAVQDADMIVIGPSNPWLSIHPILSVPEMRTMLQERPVARVAVTPIVRGDSLKGPAAKMMRDWGYEVSAQAVATYYDSVINGFVYDIQDQDSPVEGIVSNALDTVMDTEEKRVILAQNLLDWMEELQL